MNITTTPSRPRTGLLGWLLLVFIVALAAFPLLVQAADAAPAASGSSALSAVTVESAPGAITVTGLPPSWDAIWLRILSLAGSVVLVARVVVKLTPTPKDDSFLDKIVECLKHLGLSTPDKP